MMEAIQETEKYIQTLLKLKTTGLITVKGFIKKREICPAAGKNFQNTLKQTGLKTIIWILQNGKRMMNRPALKYNGGKFRLRNWIISNFPDHRNYVETCFGAGSVLLSKKRSGLEVANDIDGNVNNFFTVLRDNPKELIRMISFTEYSEESLSHSLENIFKEEDPIKKAYYFYVISWLSLRANDIRKSNLNFRVKGNIDGTGGHNPARLFSETKHLKMISDRLKGVIFTQKDAIEVINEFDNKNTLFYVDLPYLFESRGRDRLYTEEFGEIEEHSKILERLTEISGMAVVSHYKHDLYDSMLSGWETVSQKTNSNSFQKGHGKKEKARIEYLYINQSATNRIQPTLFQEKMTI